MSTNSSEPGCAHCHWTVGAGTPASPTGTSGDRNDADRGSVDLGERLLALVAEARRSGTDPEQALRDAVRRLVANNTEPIE